MLLDACREHMHFGPYYSQQVALQKEHKRGAVPQSLKCDHSQHRLSASPPNEVIGGVGESLFLAAQVGGQGPASNDSSLSRAQSAQ